MVIFSDYPGNVCLGKVLVWDGWERRATTSPSLRFCLEKRRLLERTEPELGARTYKERHFTSREESFLVATANYWAVWMSRGLTAWGGMGTFKLSFLGTQDTV